MRENWIPFFGTIWISDVIFLHFRIYFELSVLCVYKAHIKVLSAAVMIDTTTIPARNGVEC